MEKKVLIIEDDTDLVDLIGMHLKDIGCLVETSQEGPAGLEMALKNPYDLIILDLMLPGMDGLEICRQLRSENKTVPILMLTSKSEELDKILGLELGANDYITKPFSIRELLARVKTNLRSMEAVKKEAMARDDQTELRFGNLVVNFEKRRVMIGEKPVELTAREFDLLAHFVRHPGRTYTREQLLNEIWGYQFSGYDHTVNSHINRLRNKIEADPAKPDYIRTIWGVGYRFAEPGELET
jgi:two-component system alkaline phosphatase synthesis response regulator PhoP